MGARQRHGERLSLLQPSAGTHSRSLLLAPCSPGDPRHLPSAYWTLLSSRKPHRFARRLAARRRRRRKTRSDAAAWSSSAELCLCRPTCTRK